MRWCCPHGLGCNAPGGRQQCALELCRAAAVDVAEAARAVSRWQTFERGYQQRCSDGERRFRRRSYQRARDEALIALALRPASAPPRTAGRRRAGDASRVPVAAIAAAQPLGREALIAARSDERSISGEYSRRFGRSDVPAASSAE